MMIGFDRTTNELKFNYNGGTPTKGPVSHSPPGQFEFVPESTPYRSTRT